MTYLSMNACPFPQPGITATYALLIPQLAAMARNLIRDLDPQVRHSREAQLPDIVPRADWP